mmetsp:Transcript_9246/g.12029  ORF Transcript_9246/g.12029 Transcript_9246/m.12029 type:complete len:82 (-) Transcript_9246:227-472(-)
MYVFLMEPVVLVFKGLAVQVNLVRGKCSAKYRKEESGVLRRRYGRQNPSKCKNSDLNYTHCYNIAYSERQEAFSKFSSRYI